MTTFVGGNLNFGRTATQQQRDVDEMKAAAEVVCTCEDIRDGLRRERVLVPGSRLRIERSGRQLSARSKFGKRIGWRYFAWKDVETPEVGTVRVVSAHMPPLRMRGPLYTAYAWRLRRLLRTSPHPWLVFADWNWLIHKDPAGLESKLGAKFFGRRIDGWAVHPGLVKHVCNYRVYDPKRRDEHVYTFIDLKEFP